MKPSLRLMQYGIERHLHWGTNLTDNSDRSLSEIQQMVKDAELMGAYSIYKPALPARPARPKGGTSIYRPDTPRRGRPKLSPKIQHWHDLKLEKKYHRGLAALVILTHKPTGEFWLRSTRDVWEFFLQVEHQLRGNQMINPDRLQRLYDYIPDFHVQLVTCGQWQSGESLQRELAWRDGVDHAAFLLNHLSEFHKDNLLCINSQRMPYDFGPFGARPIRVPEDYQPQATTAEEISYRKFTF